jgi:hypothetical protein
MALTPPVVLGGGLASLEAAEASGATNERARWPMCCGEAVSEGAGAAKECAAYTGVSGAARRCDAMRGRCEAEPRRLRNA